MFRSKRMRSNQNRIIYLINSPELGTTTEAEARCIRSVMALFAETSAFVSRYFASISRFKYQIDWFSTIAFFFFFFKSIKTRLLRIFSSKFFLPRSFARVKEKQSQRRRERKKGNEKWMDRNSSEKKTKSNEHEVKL